MNSNVSSCNFFGRVWIAEEDVMGLEVWVNELEPVNNMSRTGAEWVRDHLYDYDVAYWRDVIKQPKEDERSWQILFEGTIKGHCDYFGEYDEDCDIEAKDFCEVPKEWWDCMKDMKTPYGKKQ